MKPRSRWKIVRGKLKAHILEEDILHEIVMRLWYEYRIKVWRIRERIPGVGALSVAGIPDLIGWVPSSVMISRSAVSPVVCACSQPLFIEVKRPGGRRRPAQEIFIDQAKADGCIAFFAESWDEVVKQLHEHGIGERKAA